MSWLTAGRSVTRIAGNDGTNGTLFQGVIGVLNLGNGIEKSGAGVEILLLPTPTLEGILATLPLVITCNGRGGGGGGGGGSCTVLIIVTGGGAGGGGGGGTITVLFTVLRLPPIGCSFLSLYYLSLVAYKPLQNFCS